MFLVQCQMQEVEKKGRKKMKKNRKVFDNEFRNSAIRYVQEHKELTHAQAAENLGVGKSTLARWISEAKQSDDGIINMRGTGNYESDEAKEIARLKRELRDTKDALEILHQGRTASKKLSAYWAIDRSFI